MQHRKQAAVASRTLFVDSQTCKSAALPSFISGASFPAPSQDIVTALDAIDITPYENSFASRLHGRIPECCVADRSALFMVDTETCTPWMGLLSDIHQHHSLAQYDHLLSF